VYWAFYPETDSSAQLDLGNSNPGIPSWGRSSEYFSRIYVSIYANYSSS